MSKVLSIKETPNPILNRIAEEVREFNTEVLDTLIDDMLMTVSKYDGVGIAAPQVGVSKRIIIVASKPNSRYPYAPELAPIVMINPQIISYSETNEIGWEGCLSVPDSRGEVLRSSNIKMTYMNRYGDVIKAEYESFIARIIQHEIDHLNGILFTERMQKADRLINEYEFQALISSV